MGDLCKSSEVEHIRARPEEISRGAPVSDLGLDGTVQFSQHDINARVDFEMQSIQIGILQENKSQLTCCQLPLFFFFCSISIKNVPKIIYL